MTTLSPSLSHTKFCYFKLALSFFLLFFYFQFGNYIKLCEWSSLKRIMICCHHSLLIFHLLILNDDTFFIPTYFCVTFLVIPDTDSFILTYFLIYIPFPRQFKYQVSWPMTDVKGSNFMTLFTTFPLVCENDDDGDHHHFIWNGYWSTLLCLLFSFQNSNVNLSIPV